MKEKGKIPEDKLIYVDFTGGANLKTMREWFKDNNMENDDLGFYFTMGKIHQALTGKKDDRGQDLCDLLRSLIKNTVLATVWGYHRHPERFKIRLVKREQTKEEGKSYIG